MAITPDDVKAITGSKLGETAIQPFIDAAACIMLQITDCTANMTAACVDSVEAYLASHLLVSSSVGKSSAAISKESLRGKYSVEYLSTKMDKGGVLSTTYGQTANMMSGGCLAELDKSPTRFISLGSLGC